MRGALRTMSHFFCSSDHAADLVVQVRQWYELTVRAVLGDDDQDDKEVILNRTLKITDSGLDIFRGFEA